jgi:hypothetical protein
MLTVCCLNSANYQGCGELYVERLRSMVARHLSIPHEFKVFTEADVSLAGWWGKLEIIERRFDDWVLFLDLDVVITSSIDALVRYPHGKSPKNMVWMRDDFSYSIVNPRTDLDAETRELLGGPGVCNSSVMLWYRGWQLGPVGELMETVHGDQNVLTAKLWPDHIGLLPNDMVKSYKYHVGEIAPVVVFHGEPKPHQLPNDPLIRDFWR